MPKLGTLVMDGREYVVLPKEEYLSLVGPEVDPVYAEFGLTMRFARKRAGLTQAQLARKLNCSQAKVSAVETGRLRVGGRYEQRVYTVCGTPPLAEIERMLRKSK